MRRLSVFSALVLGLVFARAGDEILTWTPLPDVPSSLGVAGPYTGFCDGNLVVAGGANFPLPVWETDKVWHDEVYVLSLQEEKAKWRTAGKLPRPLGYGTTVSLPQASGIVCIGGNDAERVFDDVFLLTFPEGKLQIDPLPSLPTPLVYSCSARHAGKIFVVGGQTGPGLETATNAVYSLDYPSENAAWKKESPFPGPARAFASLVSTIEGDSTVLFLIGGRRMNESGEVEFLNDVYRLGADTNWKRVADLPRPNAAGTAAFVDGKVCVVAGADGSLFAKSDELKDDHPGFPKTVLVYDPVENEWSEAGEVPANQVTTEAVPWSGGFFLPSGEVRPRVRTPKVWWVQPTK